MNIKAILVGVLVVVGLTTIIYYVDRGPDHISTFDEQLLIIEDSVYELLTESEITQMQNFGHRAINAAAGETTIYSPHAKYLSNGAILAYMMFINNTGETVTSLDSISVKMIAGNSQTIAGAVFPSVRNLPPLAPGTIFLFAFVFHPDTVQQNQADLTSYYTETYFDYTTQ